MIYRVFAAISDICWREALPRVLYDDFEKACHAADEKFLNDTFDHDFVVAEHRDAPELYRAAKHLSPTEVK